MASGLLRRGNGGTSFGTPPQRTPSPGQGEGWGGGRRPGRALIRERARSYGRGWEGVETLRRAVTELRQPMPAALLGLRYSRFRISAATPLMRRRRASSGVGLQPDGGGGGRLGDRSRAEAQPTGERNDGTAPRCTLPLLLGPRRSLLATRYSTTRLPPPGRGRVEVGVEGLGVR